MNATDLREILYEGREKAVAQALREVHEMLKPALVPGPSPEGGRIPSPYWVYRRAHASSSVLTFEMYRDIMTVLKYHDMAARDEGRVPLNVYTDPEVYHRIHADVTPYTRMSPSPYMRDHMEGVANVRYAKHLQPGDIVVATGGGVVASVTRGQSAPPADFSDVLHGLVVVIYLENGRVYRTERDTVLEVLT